MNVKLKPKKYLRYLYLPNLFGTQRTKEILHVNPTIMPQREEAREVLVTIYNHNGEIIEDLKCHEIEPCLQYKDNGRIAWINIDGLRKADVETIGNHFGIHYLIL